MYELQQQQQLQIDATISKLCNVFSVWYDYLHNYIYVLYARLYELNLNNSNKTNKKIF